MAENEVNFSINNSIFSKGKDKSLAYKDLADSCYHKASLGVKDLLQSERVIIKLIQ